jgi:hypothetical protein
MNRKILIILAVVLVVLAAAATVPLWRGRVDQSLAKPVAPVIKLTGFGLAADRFSITGSGTTTFFTKKDGVWQVNGSLAKSDSIQALFAALDATVVGDLVAKNPANHADLGVTTETGYTLHVEQGSNKLDLIVGRLATDGQSFYLRTTADNNVYLATGTLRQQVIQPDSAWLAPPPPTKTKGKTTTTTKKP